MNAAPASLADLSAVDLVAGYRAGTLDPLAVTEAVLARIAACEPVLHATWMLDPDGARSAAAASAERWKRGAPQGPVDGVPVTIKENIATRGVPVPLGTAAMPLVPAAQDAPPAARLRESGAVILGKTTMPDYGMLSSGLSSFHALARNPWNPALNPGGSSSGAAAAAAAGYGPLHIGTDIGGSIRLPAGWCGVVGLKPSWGRIPIDPPYLGRVAGPMTRSVADAALMMQVLAQPDERDHMSLPPADIAWDAIDGLDARGLRLALHVDAGCGLPTDPRVQRAVRDAAERFARAGAEIVEIEPYFTRAMLDGMDDFFRIRSWLDLRALPPAVKAKVLPYIVQWAEGGEGLSGERVFKGFAATQAMREAAVKAMRGYHAILSPTAPVVAFPAELASPNHDPARPFEHIAYTLPYNMSEQPAISIGCGQTDDGLPIGLQIAGHRHDDLGVLRLARLWETLRAPSAPWPDVSRRAPTPAWVGGRPA